MMIHTTALSALFLSGCADIELTPDTPIDIKAEMMSVFPIEIACENMNLLCRNSHDFDTNKAYKYACDYLMNQRDPEVVECFALTEDSCASVKACDPQLYTDLEALGRIY